MKFLKLKKTKLIFILCLTAFVLIVFGIRKYADPSIVNILSDFLLQSKSISKKKNRFSPPLGLRISSRWRKTYDYTMRYIPFFIPWKEVERIPAISSPYGIQGRKSFISGV